MTFIHRFSLSSTATNLPTKFGIAVNTLTFTLLMGCGGGASTTVAVTATTPVVTTPAVTTPVTPVADLCPTASKGPATGVYTAPATPIAQLPLAKRGAALATALGTPSRLLVGLGTVDISVVQAQAVKVDIYDQYLSGVGSTAWPSYASPSGAYVQTIAKNADCIGAVPMFTLYQMASNGDGNVTHLQEFAFMKQYWDQVRLLFTQLKTYGKPALVNFEPDFWGYTQRISRDPTQEFAQVSATSGGDCATLTDDIVGIAGCLVQMARKYAPNAYVGFPPSNFPDLAAAEPGYMKLIGADKADFAVMQTLDRDVGCIEANYTAASCNRITSTSAPNNALKIWDETNTTSPSFTEHFASARSYANTLNLPLLWWQTPMGVPSATPGGTVNAFRDNRVRYFLAHASEMTAAGGFGVVFSPGHTSQTTLATDGGQFKTLSTSYLAKPTALP